MFTPKQYIAIVLITLVIAISAFLVFESAGFYQSVFPEASTFKALAVATLLEISAMCLIVWQPEVREVKAVKYIIVAAFFVVIVFCASLYSIRPIVESSTISEFDKQRIESLKSQISTQEKAVDAVKGQKINSAITSRTLSGIQEELIQAYRDAKASPEAMLNSNLNHFKIFLLISIRTLLQFCNWLFIHLSVGLLGNKPKEKQYVDFHVKRFDSPIKTVKMESESESEGENEISVPVPELTDPEKRIYNYLQKQLQCEVKRPKLQATLKGIDLDSAIASLKEKGMLTVSGNGKKTSEVYSLCV